MSQPFFRKRKVHKNILSLQESVRQGSAVRSALAALPDSGTALAFLNSYHDLLEGRPLDVAVASDAGLEAVMATLGTPSRAAVPAGLASSAGGGA